MLPEKPKLAGFGPYVLDLSERILRKGEQIVPLAPKVAETLCILVENHGRLMTKDELMNRLWSDSFVEERNLAQNIFTIRKALNEKEGGQKFIETVPRRGYRFIADVSAVKMNGSDAAAIDNIAGGDGDVFKPAAVTVQAPPVKKRYGLPILGALVLAGALIVVGLYTFRAGRSDRAAVPGDAYSNGSQLKRVTDTGKSWLPAISPDGGRIAYVYHNDNSDGIRVQDMATGAVSDIVPPSKAEIGQPEFSPDGDQIFYTAREGGLEATVYRISLHGGDPKAVAKNARSEVSVSPDGNHLAFIRFNPEADGLELITAATDGSDERSIARRKGDKQFRVWETSPAWSPDGKKIIAAAFDQTSSGSDPQRRNYLVEIDTASGAETEIVSPGFYTIAQPIWDKNGNAIYAVAQDSSVSPLQIWRIERSSGKALRVTNDVTNYERLSLSADGKSLVAGVRSTFYNIWVHDLKGESPPAQLTRSVALRNGFFGIIWTPDSREVIFSQTDNVDAGNLWAVNVETGQERQLTFEETASNRWPAVTPDGRFVIYASNRSGQWHLWRMDLYDGSVTQLTSGVGESHPQLSPDGKRLIYSSPGDVPKSTWSMNIPDGIPQKILDDTGGPAHFSPDSTMLAINYFDPNERSRSPWKFGIMPADGGALPQELPLNSERSILRWRNDGNAIYFIEPGRTHNNVFVYELSSKASRPVTSFTEMKIVNMGLSPNGRYLALARGNTASDIIKISC